MLPYALFTGVMELTGYGQPLGAYSCRLGRASWPRGPVTTGEGEEMAGETETGDERSVHGEEGTWLGLSKVEVGAVRWRYLNFIATTLTC